MLDLKFYSYDSRVTLTVEGADGAVRQVRVRKAEGQPLGLNFEHYLMDKMKRCSNRCVFCFIDQLPKGMRETLYVKDDDARLSFLMGNYISMTNLSEEDVQRILRMHISPINISVQTTNPELRVKMLQNRRAGEALALLPRFAGAGITMNCQLVVCEGLNDGEELKRSLHDLEALFPAVNSISVVPFGQTRHREGLYPLKATTPEGAGNILDIVEPFAAACLEKHGTRLAWCGDELYLKAGRPAGGARAITRISPSLRTASACCRCSVRNSGWPCRLRGTHAASVHHRDRQSRPDRRLQNSLTKRGQCAII